MLVFLHLMSKSRFLYSSEEKGGVEECLQELEVFYCLIEKITFGFHKTVISSFAYLIVLVSSSL